MKITRENEKKLLKKHKLKMTKVTFWLLSVTSGGLK